MQHVALTKWQFPEAVNAIVIEYTFITQPYQILKREEEERKKIQPYQAFLADDAHERAFCS